MSFNKNNNILLSEEINTPRYCSVRFAPIIFKLFANDLISTNKVIRGIYQKIKNYKIASANPRQICVVLLHESAKQLNFLILSQVVKRENLSRFALVDFNRLMPDFMLQNKYSSGRQIEVGEIALVSDRNNITYKPGCRQELRA